MLFKKLGFDDEAALCSLLDVEYDIHREPPVLTYQIRTLRSSGARCFFFLLHRLFGQSRREKETARW